MFRKINLFYLYDLRLYKLNKMNYALLLYFIFLALKGHHRYL